MFGYPSKLAWIKILKSLAGSILATKGFAKGSRNSQKPPLDVYETSLKSVTKSDCQFLRSLALNRKKTLFYITDFLNLKTILKLTN